VKDVGGRGTGPYLVLEGNRRTAALQHLTTAEVSLRAHVRESVKQVTVKVFQYIGGRGAPAEEDVIQTILGSIHINGPLSWGALEKATYVYRSYQRLLGPKIAFRYDPQLAEQAGRPFSLKPVDVRKMLTICRVYEQLRAAHPSVDPSNYTLLEMAISNVKAATLYFELDEEAREFSDVGIDRFIKLILSDDAPISNPPLFRKFFKILQDGTPNQIRQAEEGERSIADVSAAVKKRKEKYAFRESLRSIINELNDLKPSDFQNTKEEIELILKLKSLFDKAVLPLAKQR
jgi:hypothetical protein